MMANSGSQLSGAILIVGRLHVRFDRGNGPLRIIDRRLDLQVRAGRRFGKRSADCRADMSALSDIGFRISFFAATPDLGAFLGGADE